MPAGGLRREFHVHHSLFSNTDHAAGALYSGKYILHHRSAFIENERGSYSLLREPVDYIYGSLAIYLFPAGIGEIHVVLGDEALRYQMVGSRKGGVEGVLRVQCPSSPHDAVLVYQCVKGRLCPSALIYGYDIVMCHHYRGLVVLFSLPLEEKASSVKSRQWACLPEIGIELGKQADELVEFRVVLETVVVIGHRPAADQRLKI